MYSLYRFPIDRSLFDGACGLSCVENLLIFALRASCMAYPYLFYRSHLTLPEIMREFFERNASYARFGAVERIQELAVREDLLSMELHVSLHDGLCGPEKAWVFVMLTPEAVREKYRTEMLREDHYILLGSAEGERYTCFNDTPRDIGTMTGEELERCFGGRVICIRPTGRPFDGLRKEAVARMTDALSKKDTACRMDYADLLTLRDILGVLRILRRRTVEFSSMYTDARVFSPYLEELDKRYAGLEYRRLRKKTDESYNRALFEELLEEDERWLIDVKNALYGAMEETCDEA